MNTTLQWKTYPSQSTSRHRCCTGAMRAKRVGPYRSHMGWPAQKASVEQVNPHVHHIFQLAAGPHLHSMGQVTADLHVQQILLTAAGRLWHSYGPGEGQPSGPDTWAIQNSTCTGPTWANRQCIFSRFSMVKPHFAMHGLGAWLHEGRVGRPGPI